MAREWHLVRRPGTHASPDDFALVHSEPPAPGPGQVVVRNTYLSVDPYMRGRMDDRPSYVPPFPLDAPLDGAAVGVVVESRAAGLKAGQVVEHFAGLREVAVLDAAAVSVHRMPDFRAELDPLLRTGRVVHHQSVVDGVERFPEVLLGQLRGGATTTTGKAVIRVEDAA
jgi:NADPH-dependent curcumin reductase CurA